MLIKHKLIANTCIFIVAMLAILGVLNFSISSLKQDLNIAKGIGDIKSGVLTLRRSEKDFLARKEMKYVDSFEDTSQSLNQTLNQLKSNFDKIGGPISEVENLSSIIKEYQQHFKNIVSSQQRIGLHPKDALYGQLRSMVHKAEEAIAGQDYQILSQMLQLRRNEKDFMLRLDEKYVEQWNVNADVFTQLIESSTLNTNEKETIIENANAYKSAFINLVNEYKILGYSSKEGLQGEMRSSIHKADKILTTLLQISDTAEKERVDFIYILAYSIFSFVVIITLGFASYISKNIISRINTLKSTMNNVAQTKDLTIIVDAKNQDELGEMAITFNQMIFSFKHLIDKVNNSVSTLNSATQSLSNGIRTTNNGVDEQIQQTDMVATAVTEMAATVEAIANNTNAAASKAESTSNNAINGQEGVNKTIAKIDELSQNLITSEAVVNDLAQDAVTIGSVLDVIRGIADQTNLLALNAAIEAARAGEHGRGFAVVADEVRTLASRTQDSTQEIETIINSLQERTKKIVEHMASCRIQGQESSEQASIAGSMLEEIAQDVNTIMEMSSTIATAIHEQTTVASEVNRHVVAIRDVADQTGQESKHNAQMSEELSEQAKVLNNEVKQFKV